jgi:hypothetical protein
MEIMLVNIHGFSDHFFKSHRIRDRVEVLLIFLMQGRGLVNEKHPSI